MKAKDLLDAIGNIADRHIEGSAPGRDAPGKRKVVGPKRRLVRYAAIAACAAGFIFAVTALAANHIQNSISHFYLRYLSPGEMAIADSMAEQYGADVYFDGLKSDDLRTQYFAINKLVEYYNDEEVRAKAIDAITPFLTSESEQITDAAAFALSVLTQTFDDPRIIRLADDSLIFALFNNYSDYGTYNQLWRIKDGKLSDYMKFAEPQMYIRYMVPSPDAKLLAVYAISNRSGYIVIHDLIDGYISAELVDSARNLIAKDMGYSLRQRPDFENYSSLEEIDRYPFVIDWSVDGAGEQSMLWVDNDTLEFGAALTGDIMGSKEYGDFFVTATVRYDYRQMKMEYSIISDAPIT